MQKIELGKNPSRVCCLHLLFFWGGGGGGNEGGCICRWLCFSPTRPEIPNLALKGPGTYATRKKVMEFKVFASFSGRGHRVLGLKFQGRCRGFLGGGRETTPTGLLLRNLIQVIMGLSQSQAQNPLKSLCSPSMHGLGSAVAVRGGRI